jgi:TolB-like protein/class 3 adenylate cyclase
MAGIESVATHERRDKVPVTANRATYRPCPLGRYRAYNVETRSHEGGLLTNERVERRLTAILAADIAGYSRLMGADEEGTLVRLKAHRRELVDPKIAEHRGRIVKTTGDGMLVEFASVVDAVRCAVDVQRGMAERNVEVPSDRRIEFRVGINLGDIIVEGKDIYGDGVNIAARLEGLAEPSGICVSRTVRNQVRDKVPYAFEDMGEQSVKNIARLLRVYRVRLDRTGATTAEPTRSALPLPNKPSIAVLPFQNMSGDAEQEYFADGIVEDLITALSHVKWLFVIARNSSFVYKGKVVDLKRVARELGVRYVLEGSVRKGGSRVRITGQLIEAATGSHIWADRFDGALADVFDLQDQVTANVVGAIEPKLRIAEIERAQRKPTDSLDAYDLYLRALPHFHALTVAGSDDALRLLRRAFELDPTYALAAAMMARCYAYRGAQGWVADPNEEADEAVRLAHTALDADSDDPEVLHMAGFTLAYVGGDNQSGSLLIGRSLSINPNSAQAWSASGHVRGWMRDPDTAVEHFERAIRLSPFDPLLSTFYGGIAMAHFEAKRYGAAVEWADKGVRIGPKFLPAYRWLAAGLARLDRLEEARATARRLMVLDPSGTLAGLRRRRSSFNTDLLDDYLDGLRKAGLPE